VVCFAGPRAYRLDLGGADLRVGGLSPRAVLTSGKGDGSEKVAFGLGGCSDDAVLLDGGVLVAAGLHSVSGAMRLPVFAGSYELCWSLNGAAGTYVGVGVASTVGECCVVVVLVLCFVCAVLFWCTRACVCVCV